MRVKGFALVGNILYDVFMPSQILHILFGEDLVAEIYHRLAPKPDSAAGKFLEKIWDRQGKAFALGCQGPDIFYHSRRARPVGLEYGTLLHRRAAGTFTAWLLELAIPKRREDEALAAYALGFMSHAVLDRAAHPYILYKSVSNSPAKSETMSAAHSHTFFERIIDTLMLKKLRGMNVSLWDQEALLAETCENPPPGLPALLETALVRTFPERAGKDEKLARRIENTFNDAAYFYRLTTPMRTSSALEKDQDSFMFPLKKRHLIYLFPKDLPCDIDFLNLAKKPWFYPVEDGKEDVRSFPELYLETVDNTASSLGGIICRFLEGGEAQGENQAHISADAKKSEADLRLAEAARIIGDGGLSIVDKTGKPCAPGRTDPLPLDEVLEKQAVFHGIKKGADANH